MQANCSRRTQTLSDGHHTSVGGLLLRNASCLTIVASTRLLWPGSTCTLCQSFSKLCFGSRVRCGAGQPDPLSQQLLCTLFSCFM